ncbi:50S ribosomal protein L28 [Patescibacteria group bacterium]|nr:50S ribosomal protein L28 [Patescibacteria group bacterium]
MAKVCEVCERGTTSGQTKSHSQIKTKRQVKINLQTKVVDGKRIKICTKCMRTMNK